MTVTSVAAPITRVLNGKDLKFSFYIRILNALHEYATEEEFVKIWKEVGVLLFWSDSVKVNDWLMFRKLNFRN